MTLIVSDIIPAKVKISEYTVPVGGATTIGFSPISGIYNSLELAIYGASDSAALTFDHLRARFNGDSTASHYDAINTYTQFDVVVPNDERNETSAVLGDFVTTTSLDPTFMASINIVIPGYSQTVFKKVAYSFSISQTNQYDTLYCGAWWHSAAAITAISLFLTNGNFVVGTKAVLYGVY